MTAENSNNNNDNVVIYNERVPTIYSGNNDYYNNTGNLMSVTVLGWKYTDIWTPTIFFNTYTC